MHMEGLLNVIDRSTLTPERLRSLAAIQAYRERLNSLTERLQGTRSAIVHVLLDRYYTRTRDRYYAELGRFSNLPGSAAGASAIRVTPSVATRDAGHVMKDIADQWAAASLMMQTMLAARAVPYFHFLQPNQYFTTRAFTDAERRTAFNAGSPFRDGAERGYPLLIAASGALAAQERFFSAVGIFDTVSAPVYIDDCCHYTLAGNHALADFIAASVLRAGLGKE
jgi:hypothetical protein